MAGVPVQRIRPPEVYAEPFPGPGQKVKISVDGGAQMRWRRDGRELFYLGRDRRLMAVPIRPAANGYISRPVNPCRCLQLRVAEIVPLAERLLPRLRRRPQWPAIPHDHGHRRPTVPPITVILNWKPKTPELT